MILTKEFGSLNVGGRGLMISGFGDLSSTVTKISSEGGLRGGKALINNCMRERPNPRALFYWVVP